MEKGKHNTNLGSNNPTQSLLLKQHLDWIQAQNASVMVSGHNHNTSFDHRVYGRYDEGGIIRGLIGAHVHLFEPTTSKENMAHLVTILPSVSQVYADYSAVITTNLTENGIVNMSWYSDNFHMYCCYNNVINGRCWYSDHQLLGTDKDAKDQHRCIIVERPKIEPTETNTSQCH
eukprot:180006_1